MKPLVDPPVIAEPELDLLLHLDKDPKGTRRSAILSVLVHIVGTIVLTNVQFEATSIRDRKFPEIVVHKVTPLVAPPPDVFRELTQKAPNVKPPSKELDLPGLMAKAEVKAPPPKAAVSPTPRTGAPAPAPQLPVAPQIQEAPQPQMAQGPPMGTGLSNMPPPPAPERPPEKPKISFESVPGSGRSTGNVSGSPSPGNRIEMPKSSVEEAVARVTRRPGSSGVVVGDDTEAPTLGETLGQRPTPGKLGSQLELLSDPQGVDFRPYLIKVLSAVRRNWFAVIPESARLGRTGRVVVQFSISKNGSVPKLVIAVPSGADPLDRAAVAGISASNPFPPLPVEFKGEIIRVQLAFGYNQSR